MFYRRRALPKHHYDMIEVDYVEGGTAHGLEKSTCVSSGAPSPVYKGVEEGEGRPSTMARPGESYSHLE